MNEKVSLHDALALAQSRRVRHLPAVENLQDEHVHSPMQVLTVSAGVATASSDSWDRVVNRVDRALYRAKDAGRNRIVVSE